MPPVTRIGDMSTGHGCYPPRPAVGGSPNVYTNNIPTVRLNDPWDSHACPGTPPHSGNTSSGSSTVYVNNLPVCRIGDSISCGGASAEGSPNVIAGG